MNTIKTDSLSEFGMAAIALDVALQDYDRLAADLGRADVQSDKGLARAQEVLERVEASRTELANQMQSFAGRLQQARTRCDEVEAIVAEKTGQVNDRVQFADALFRRLKMLGEMVHAITQSLATLKGPGEEAVSNEEKGAMLNRLPEFNEKISVLIEEAKRLTSEARQANLKTLEQNSDTIRQTLQSAQNKFNLYIEKHTATAGTVH